MAENITNRINLKGNNDLIVGMDKVVEFFRKEYFDSFTAKGGASIKFLSGKKGSGKSSLLALLEQTAKEEGFYTSSLSADTIYLNDFSQLYLEILNSFDFETCVIKICSSVVKDCGYSYAVSSPLSVLDQMANDGTLDPLTRQELKSAVKRKLLNNPYMDRNFALVLSLFCYHKLGLADLEDTSKDILLRWIHADKDLKLTTLRSFGLLPYRINKYNARSLIRSLSELVKLAGYQGLFVGIDNLDILISTSSLEAVHYTKMKRDDAYEALRQLVDEVDTFRYIFFVFVFDHSLLHDEKNGIKSYQALWLRLQNEIVSKRLNLFQNLLDMERINETYLTAEVLVEMSERLSTYLTTLSLSSVPISRDKAESIISQAKLGALPMPILVNQETTKLD
ncbi:MAG: DUF2791 family P-loop domain-containing protein [Spirochaetales bacterium]|nr:DUF2791 family P-loop domain-containing protein [Candidatus Physcosoma equi]